MEEVHTEDGGEHEFGDEARWGGGVKTDAVEEREGVGLKGGGLVFPSCAFRRLDDTEMGGGKGEKFVH